MSPVIKILVEDLREFTARQGCGASVFDRNTKKQVFANGSTCFAPRFGAVQESADPPDDPKELLTRQVLYWTIRRDNVKRMLQQCIADIDQRREWAASSSNCIPPGEQDMENLRLMKADLKLFNENLEPLQEQLAELQGPTRADQYEERQAQRHQVAHATRRKMDAILDS